MSLRQRLCEYLCEKPDIPRPFTKLRLRSSQLILQRLRRQFPNAQIRLPDPNLSAPTLKETEKWLLKDITSEKEYNEDWFDCEDFAREIRCKVFKIGQAYKTTLTIAYCEGYNPKDYHGYNLLIDDKDEIYIIEPQTDHLVPAHESDYRTDFIQL